MNKAEKLALIELGLTEEQLAERGAKVSAMISEPIGTAQEYTITDKGTGGATPFDAPVILTRTELGAAFKKPDRKPRSDKGRPKPPKAAPQAPGTLTTAQVLEITRLYAAEMLAVDVSRQAQMEAVILAGKVEEAYNAWVAYLETLAKGV